MNIEPSMEKEQTINLILVHDDVDEANRLVSLLRNANYDVAPQYAANATELNKRIQERNWELILAQHPASSVPAKNIIHQIRRLNKDIPVIFILDEYNPADMVECLKMGGADAVPMDEDQLFIQLVARTLFNLEQRRKLRYWQRRFSESEDRFENLILSSQDGIAIIQEGTYVHVNDAYAGFFGYLDADNMVLMPVIDTVASESQREFKKYLKPLEAENAWDMEVIRFDALTTEEQAIPVQATLSQIDFHGEPALQLLIKKEFLAHARAGSGDTASPAAGKKEAEPVTSATDITKIRTKEMVESINSTIRRAAKTGEDALLFNLPVDHYDEIQQRLGMGLTEHGLAQLAHFLDTLIPERAIFGRIREEAFVFIVASNDAEKGMALANRIVREVSSQIFNTDQGSFTCTLSAGITPIGEATASADEALGNCQKTVAELQKTDASGKYGNAAKFHEPVFELQSDNLSDADVLRIGKQLIKKNQTSISFQPIIPLLGSQQEIYEVLMGIDKEAFADKEIPADFVTNVFRTSIGRDFDQLVIGDALKKLREKKRSAPQTQLCMHISYASMADEKFIGWLQRSIESSDLQPQDLIFQLREIDISHHMGEAARTLDRLKNLGTLTGLSHYGLAINPATIFNRIKVDYVKVDRALSDKAQKDKAALEELKNLITELKELKQTVIVPHIESATIIPTLWQAGVDFLEGYYIQGPSSEMTFDFSEE